MSAYKPSAGVPGSYEEYPKWMYAVSGSGAQIVNDAAEEKALGKDFSPNKPGHKAVEAVYTEDSSAPVFAEFPKWKYHALKPGVIVSSAKEESALGAGWHDTQAAAKEAAMPDPVLSSIPADPIEQDGLQLTEAEIIAIKQQREAAEKNDLVDQAVALGIRVNKSWGLVRLRKEVEAAKTNGG